MKKLLIALAVTAALVAPAQARRHHHHHTAHSRITYGRPAARAGIPWCGCWLRLQFGINNARYNLARAWATLGQAAQPAIGVVVVWAHHVGVITGFDGRNWVVKSGNDGHAVRERPRSLAGAIAIRRL